MAKLNVKDKHTEVTHEGGPAKRITPEKELRRSVMACLLWEKSFYENGEDIAQRIFTLTGQVNPDRAMNIALEARNRMNLRHAPLFVASSMAYHHRGSPLIQNTIAEVIQRADELTEFVSIHAKLNNVKPGNVKKTLSAQIKKGLATAFRQFDAYQLAKYDRQGAIRLRDVLFLCHAKPKGSAQDLLWKKLIYGKLESPDTWETNLSSGKNKRETFERLLIEKRLGYLALLRNLRGMLNAGVNMDLIRNAILERKGAHRVLPFRFVAAARHAPQLEPELDQALIASIDSAPKLPGRTIVLVDVSHSMNDRLSNHSDLIRMDAAAALASILPAQYLRVFTFSAGNVRTLFGQWDGNPICVEVPPRRGIAGVDAVIQSQYHGGTMLGMAIKEMNQLDYDRLIVITDEQSHDRVPDPNGLGYLINVGDYKNGVGYGKWIHIDGFSEAVIKYIQAMETERLA